MKKKILVLALGVGITILITSFERIAPERVEYPEIPYPRGYRDWTHVKTYIVRPGNPAFKFIGGFNQVYANDIAMQGYRTGKFPDGSMIVSDVIEAKDDSITIREGKRHHLDVMIRDSIRYMETGGWGFEEFAEDSKTKRLLNMTFRTVCSNCHAKQKDYVYGEYRE